MNAIIDQQTQDLGPPKFKVGDSVVSRAVGPRSVFGGEVESVRGYVGQSCSGWTYNVRADDDGRLWCRTDADLTAIASSVAA